MVKLVSAQSHTHTQTCPQPVINQPTCQIPVHRRQQCRTMRHKHDSAAHMKAAHASRVPVRTPPEPHLQPPLADAIPHFDTSSYNSAAKTWRRRRCDGSRGVPDEEEARVGEQIKCGGGSGGTGRGWWSILTQFVSGG